jgi:DNA repair exonuclease SbcCD ATPase subunit
VKGIIILGFEKYSKTRIDTQFPTNICEFLGVTPETLKGLVEHHMKKKMEPNYVEMMLEDDVSVASFYSGFSFRHYVGNPNFAVSIFLSQDEILSNEFEGRMRRVAHELLPKREALNFDDILGQYYEMLKAEELLPYWEEIIEGESSVITAAANLDDKKVAKEEKQEEELDSVEEKKSEEIQTKLLKEETELKAKNTELQDLLDEKKNKIRELTRKYTELVSENIKISEEIQSCKEEISEQYIKLEKWSQQMADLNQNNAKLMDDIKILKQEITERDDFLKEKERKIEALSTKLTGVEEVEDEAEKMLQEKEDLKNINLGLNSELDKLEKANRSLINDIDNLKSQITVYIDSITSLKLEAKNNKANVSTKEKEKSIFQEQMFDLKKEIKVLRRERDHYRKIVKEKNLLE